MQVNNLAKHVTALVELEREWVEFNLQNKDEIKTLFLLSPSHSLLTSLHLCDLSRELLCRQSKADKVAILRLY